MKFAFLPNYFKKIGVCCFFAMLAFVTIVSIVTVYQSLDSLPRNGDIITSFNRGMEMGENLLETNYWIAQLSGILLLLSVAFYMLAKEKVDDEYMDAMRWESLRLALIISIGITMLSILVSVDLRAKNILLILFVVYLIVFQIKKSKGLSSKEN